MKRASEIERSLIGALLALENPRRLVAAAGLEVNDFTDSQLRVCWEVIAKVAREGEPLDAMALFGACHTARLMGDEDLGLLVGLQAQNILSAAGFLEMARSLRRIARARTISSKLASLSKLVLTDNDPDALQGQFLEIGREFTRTHSEGGRGSASVIAAFEGYERRKKEGSVSLLPTGLQILDEKTGGLPPKLCCFFGKPSVGKSTLLATIIHEQLKAGLRPVLASLEDGDEWFVKRQLAQLLDMRVRDVFAKDFADGEKTQDAAQVLTSLYENLWVVTKAQARTASDLVRIFTRLRLDGYGPFYVDNMTVVQHEQGKFEDRRNAVGRSYALFADFADENRVPLVSLSHTKRAAEKEGQQPKVGPPLISDIAETADADRFIRFGLGLWRKGNMFRATVAKHNEGEPDLTFEWEVYREAALLDPESGVLVDLHAEQRREREDRQARKVEREVSAALDRKELRDKLVAKAEAEKKKAEEPKATEPEPQSSLFGEAPPF